MPPAKKGTVVDLDSVAERVVEKLTASSAFMEALSKIIKESIKEELKVITQELVEKVDQLESSVNTRIMDLEDALDGHEQYSRINNLRIFGVPEEKNEDTAQVVRSICAEKMGIDLPPYAIDIVHRLKKKLKGVIGR